MELTLNELKIIRNALNKKLRTVRLQSSEFDDIKQTLYKINFEIERIEYDTKQKACDEAFRAISDILKPKKMKDFLKSSKIELIEPNYEGIAKVLSEFEKLYKVCENKELLDKCLENFCSPKKFFNGDSNKLIEREVALRIHDVEGRSEQSVCPNCDGEGFSGKGTNEILPCLICFGSGEKVN